MVPWINWMFGSSLHSTHSTLHYLVPWNQTKSRFTIFQSLQVPLQNKTAVILYTTWFVRPLFISDASCRDTSIKPGKNVNKPFMASIWELGTF